MDVLWFLLQKSEKQNLVFRKFYVLRLGRRRCNPTSLIFTFLCFIQFKMYPADMETLNVADMKTVKGYSGKIKGTKHRVHKNNNSFPIHGQIPYSTIFGFDFHITFKWELQNQIMQTISINQCNIQYHIQSNKKLDPIFNIKFILEIKYKMKITTLCFLSLIPEQSCKIINLLKRPFKPQMKRANMQRTKKMKINHMK